MQTSVEMKNGMLMADTILQNDVAFLCDSLKTGATVTSTSIDCDGKITKCSFCDKKLIFAFVSDSMKEIMTSTGKFSLSAKCFITQMEYEEEFTNRSLFFGKHKEGEKYTSPKSRSPWDTDNIIVTQVPGVYECDVMVVVLLRPPRRGYRAISNKRNRQLAHTKKVGVTELGVFEGGLRGC